VPSLSVSRQGWVTPLAVLLAAHHLGGEKEMLNLLFVGRGLICGHDQAWENQTNHRGKNQRGP